MKNNTSKHRLAFLTWIVIYPLITIILFLFKEELIALPLIARTFVLTVVLVTAMQYLIMPFLTRKLAYWLTKTEKKNCQH
ncbi:hypothetical protein KORDIASMS9_02767 [Kordia sp. SMS9]|uniref:hypothetical protein n=1 Tax=Kordia sp. SMS9 TaxID=2282170 RepID=UPI000E0DEA5F|nr:hypothetical protein [Kordia sp. SMS9]AXG70527.1 hypothetical protein KORDIASMS9_02767 [Kordia sp. SMS9]